MEIRTVDEKPGLPPHGCGDELNENFGLCYMNLDGTCPLRSCSYYDPKLDSTAPQGER